MSTSGPVPGRVPGPLMFRPGTPWFIGNGQLVSVVQVPDEQLEPELREQILETVTYFGWQVFFEEEEETIAGFLVDTDTKETIKSTWGHASLREAWDALGVDLLPPSQELRRHQSQ